MCQNPKRGTPGRVWFKLEDSKCNLQMFRSIEQLAFKQEVESIPFMVLPAGGVCTCC